MKLAIVGSRNIDPFVIDHYIPENVDEIVSGGAKGVDTLAKEYAMRKGMKYTEFLPEYELYGKAAPLKRNEKISVYADAVLAFWNGRSKGTKSTVNLFEKLGKKVTVVFVN